LGSHRKKTVRNRLSHLVPGAAAPALAGVAAAACLAPQVLATPAAQAAVRQTAVSDAAGHVQAAPADLLTAIQAAKARAAGQTASAHKAAAGQTATYAVRSGDSLSAIAGRVYHRQDAWTVLYWANHSQIRWANIISVGQVLQVPALPARIPGAPAQLGPPAPAPAPVPAEAAAPADAAAPAEAPAPAPAAATSSSPTYAPQQASTATSNSGSYSGGSSFQQCVIARESGGNSQVMNSSGHYGLYQFSASTWAAYGGNPGDFGNASVAEQNQVFNNAMAAGGESNWGPYDGC
jgi:Transglycosylase-like domain/LysM domain